MKHATSAIWGTLEKHATTFIKGVLIPDEAVDGGYGYSCVDVTLAGGKIAALVPTGSASAPEGCIVIDGGNKLPDQAAAAGAVDPPAGAWRVQLHGGVAEPPGGAARPGPRPLQALCSAKARP